MRVGKKFLLTTDNWFFAPDGENYRAVFGTIHGVLDAETCLGIKANRNSSNWFVAIGDMIVAGCQIHYATRAEAFNPLPSELVEIDHEGARMITSNAMTRIYDADLSGLSAMSWFPGVPQ